MFMGEALWRAASAIRPGLDVARCARATSAEQSITVAVVLVRSSPTGSRQKDALGGLSLVLSLFAVVGVAAAVAVVAFWGFGELLLGTNPLVRRSDQDPRLSGVLKLALTAAAGLTALVALTVAHQRQRSAASQRQRAAERSRFNQLFADAATQLGGISASARIAGAYAMTALADETSERARRQQCIDVLCAYLRLPYHSGRGGALLEQLVITDATVTAGGRTHTDQRTYRLQPQEREVRVTIVSIISDHLQDEVTVSWRGYRLNFSGAVFDGGSFRGAEFSNGIVDFGNARFVGGTFDFSGVKFSGAQTHFAGAEFSGGTVTFAGAELSGGTVEFGGAQYCGGAVDFSGATCSGGDVTFADGEFSAGLVTFAGGEFSGATVDFSAAKFCGAAVNFTAAQFVGGVVSFAGSQFTGGTVDFGQSTVTGGALDFGRAQFLGGTVTFMGSEFSGGVVDFSGARFARCMVIFWCAKFSGGTVDFGRAQFLGGVVDFSGAQFLGGVVDLRLISSWSRPPAGLPEAAEGLGLPGDWASDRPVSPDLATRS
jgi:uncharacterized protein YjbI with pentapeptide repeats